MGPLVPDIVSPNLNYIVALIVGILFGAILEQAGFSSSKKLVGLFYGYDFTVLRVFFTAGIVAMIGVMAFNYFGLLDVSLIFINPLYIWSAIIGGLIMGLGFVIGGFCPGTSVCAAAIGKIDAMIFIGGAFLGVLIFAEGYPLFEGLYKAAYYGNPTVPETLGISQNLFAFLMVIMAVSAFIVTKMIEDKVNGISSKPFTPLPYFMSVGIIGILVAVVSFSFTDRKTNLLSMVEDKNIVSNYPIDKMSVDEFAFNLLKYDEISTVQYIDFRPDSLRKQLNFPNTHPFTVDDLFTKEPNKLLTLLDKQNIFIAQDELTAKKMAIIATELGYKRIRILEGGVQNFVEQILNYTPIENPKTVDEKNVNRFRIEAKATLPELLKEFQPKEEVKKEKKRVLGGC